jgi:glycerophosphoryl diester phosphodiesterase
MRLKIASFILIFLLPLEVSAAPWQEGRPTTVGHRGTTVFADENTIAAFTIAWEQGLDVIECDPKLTRDGVYVIMHDDDVDRTTDGHGAVADLNLAQVKKLRTHSGLAVPTLLEVLEFAGDHGLSVYLDVKHYPADGGELLVRNIEEAGMLDRTIVGCYDLRTLVSVRRLRHDLSFCVSWPYPAGLLTAALLGADAIGTLTELASPALIKTAHRLGLRVITMPVNDPQKLARLKRAGLDGLQSDDPRLLAPYGKKAAATPATSE